MDLATHLEVLKRWKAETEATRDAIQELTDNAERESDKPHLQKAIQEFDKLIAQRQAQIEDIETELRMTS